MNPVYLDMSGLIQGQCGILTTTLTGPSPPNRIRRVRSDCSLRHEYRDYRVAARE
jgi:hypothetical protein